MQNIFVADDIIAGIHAVLASFDFAASQAFEEKIGKAPIEPTFGLGISQIGKTEIFVTRQMVESIISTLKEVERRAGFFGEFAGRRPTLLILAWKSLAMELGDQLPTPEKLT